MRPASASSGAALGSGVAVGAADGCGVADGAGAGQGVGSGDGYVQLAAGSIKNSTEHPDADLRAAVTTQSLPFAI